VYLTDFVNMQPSARSTPSPGPSRKDDTWETVAGGRCISGRFNKGGTAANLLTEMRDCLVSSDMLKNVKSLCLHNLLKVTCCQCLPSHRI
jgi:hypothetical protein